jgi:hypothetical protein
VTAGPFTSGSIIKADPLGYARNGSSLVFEGTTATSESYYVRSEGGDALPSGTIAGNHAAAFSVSTAATQLVAAAGAYAFAPAALFEILPQLEKVTFSGSPIDSAGAISAMFKRSQVVPNPARDYKLRLRAKNHRSLSRPVGKIVSAAKAGSATVTITFDQPHGLTVADLVVVYGIRDQVNFANLATPTAVASVPNATTITIPMGASATATSYGGVVIRVNGGVFGAPIGQVAQSVARTANVLTVTGSAAWSGLQIGQYVNLHGVRDAVSGADLGLDGPYRVRDVATTALVLEPIGAAPTGADIGTTNCGGAVLPRTDFRVHFIRVMEFTRLITESIGGFGRVDQMDAAPVLVTNAVSAVTVTGGVAQDAAAGNPVGIGARAANANQAAMSATGDLVHLMATMIGALVNKPFSIPEADWSYAPAGAIANTADVVIAAAAGAGIRRYVTVDPGDQHQRGRNRVRDQGRRHGDLAHLATRQHDDAVGHRLPHAASLQRQCGAQCRCHHQRRQHLSRRAGLHRSLTLAMATGAHTARRPHRRVGWRSRIRIGHTARPVRHQWPTPKAKDETMPATAAAAVTVAPETLTITWLVAGGIIAELLILIVFLVRVAWWLSQRFTLIDATLAANAKEITRSRADVSNDIAGRKVVAEARTDIAQIKATLIEFRERIDRIEANEDGRKHA